MAATKKRLSRQLFHRADTWIYESIWAVGNERVDRRIRVTIRLDPIRDDSYLRAFIYDQLTSSWSMLVDNVVDQSRIGIVTEELKSTSKLKEEDFEQDEDALLEKVLLITNIG